MMSMMIGISLYIGLAILPCAVFYYRHTRNSPRPNTLDFKTGPECLKIIDSSYHPDGRRNCLSKHEARALENEKIARAFGIRNAFTTNDDEEAKRFVQGVNRLMKLSDRAWDGLSYVLYCMGWNMVPSETGETRINLASITQALTLKASLCVFFHMTGEVEFKNLVDLAAVIHKTWDDMKREEGFTVKAFKDNQHFQTRLSAVFPHHDILNPRSNPLNLIIPSFETVWRVVLRLFMELHRRGHQDEISTLAAFARNPTDAQLKLEFGEDKISAEFLVKEALRLYPPSRRIRRAYLFCDAESPVTCAADVEACQTDAKVWGTDAAEFKPERWKKAGLVQGLSFLPFGGRPFLCPASQDFGLRAVGLIAGILLDFFRDEWVLGSDNADETKDLNSRQRLKNDRGAYGGVFLANM